MPNGFISIDRRLLEWKYNDKPSAFALWVRLLLMANWKDGYFHGELIPRGSLATSIEALSMSSGLSPSTVKRCLKLFEEDGQITRKTTNRYTIINIVKYSEYQDAEYLNQQMNQQVNQQMNHNRINKQSNKYRKNIKKDILPGYMTGEFENDSTPIMDNSEYEELRKLLNPE